MIELIQSLPSPSLQQGITHSWMRETSMVDGEALVMMMAMILSKFPVLAGCQNRVSGSESWFLMVATERNSFWKNVDPPRFLGQGVTYRRRGSPRGCLGWTHPLGVGWAHPRLAGVWAPRPPLRLVFWICGSSGEIGFLAYSPGFFLIV